MHREKHRVWGANALLAGLLLAGCGGGSDGGGAVPSAATPPAEQVATTRASSSTPAAVQDAPPPLAADVPFTDLVAYGVGPDDAVQSTTEDGAVTHHDTVVNGKRIRYTATAGHLVTSDPVHSTPSAKIFYVAYTADGAAAGTRPVTFFYNGGPGSASIWLLMGSYAPKRIKTSLPDFTPPAPYTVETNPDSLIDKSDLVFINPVGTGYSAAIAPNRNQDFWGVDKDAKSLNQFIKQYLTANQRWNSPKYLFGESYGTPRSAVMSYLLHQDGIDLNGIVLLSSILDYSQDDNPVGLLPTYAAVAWFHRKTGVKPPPADLAAYMQQVTAFAEGDYAAAAAPAIDRRKRLSVSRSEAEYAAALAGALAAEGDSLTWRGFAAFVLKLRNVESAFAKFKSVYLLANKKTFAPELDDVLEAVLAANPAATDDNIRAHIANLPNHADLARDFVERRAAEDALKKTLPTDEMVNRTAAYIGIPAQLVKSAYLVVDPVVFQRNLVPGVSVGAYDGRATTTDLGVAAHISLINNDAFDRAVNGVYVAAWNFYINEELKYTSNSVFTGITDIDNWDYTHLDPTGVETKARDALKTDTDLAATMGVNPDVKVLQLSGYFDNVTPWYQTRRTLKDMKLDPALRKNLKIEEFPSGHQIYLDGPSRTAMKASLAGFYDSSSSHAATARIVQLQQRTLKQVQ